jgi:hypothetical protein
MLLITKGISDRDSKSHPIRGFGIDLWHAVEFSRYERARIFPNFVGPLVICWNQVKSDANEQLGFRGLA